jgi:MinD-like ATPase involved in chromosome partitioning or flagellar assembly
MPKIVSVHSFRGGTGKSNITSNTAVSVARTGRRVGVVDTDIQSPGIHVLFGMEADQIGRSLNDYLWSRCPIEEAAHDVSHVMADANPAPGSELFLIPSSIKPNEIARVLREGYDVSMLNDGFHRLIEKLHLDYLFIDTHPGLNEETLLSIAISDVLLLILRPDKQDFQGTAVTVDVARKLDVQRLLMVVNKALPSFGFAALRQQVTDTYKAPVAGVLPLSEDVVRLASGGIFSLRFPEHQWSHELRTIAQQVMA